MDPYRFETGAMVRVSMVSGDGSSQLALISLGNDDGTFDVIYNDGTEENNILSSRIRALEPFELEGRLDAEKGADELKEEGNTLFSLKDYSAALSWYTEATRRLAVITSSKESSSYKGFPIGQNVLVPRENGSADYKVGVISDVDGDRCDVMYDTDNRGDLLAIAWRDSYGQRQEDYCEDQDEEEEDIGLPQAKLIPLTRDVQGRQLQRALYMNMARCAFKRGTHGWAIRYVSLMLGVARSIYAMITESSAAAALSVDRTEAEIAVVRKQIMDGLYFRSKALLSANRPRLAARDAKQLVTFERLVEQATGRAMSQSSLSAAPISGSGNSNKHNNNNNIIKRGEVLLKEIASFKSRQQAVNKKLARDVVKWVDSAVAMSEQQKQQKHRDEKIPTCAVVAGGDIDIGEDGVEEEEDDDDDIHDDDYYRNVGIAKNQKHHEKAAGNFVSAHNSNSSSSSSSSSGGSGINSGDGVKDSNQSM